MKKTTIGAALCACAVSAAIALSMPLFGIPSAWADANDEDLCDDGTVYGLADGDFEYLLNPEGVAEMTGYSGTDTNLVVPDKLGGYTVYALALSNTGKDNSSGFLKVESVTLPEGLEEIRDGSFAGCASLKEVKFPQSLKRIGAGAFNGCTSLVNIGLPSKLAYVGINAFSGTSIQHVTLPGSLKAVGEDKASGPLGGMKKLQDVDLEEGIASTAGCLFGNGTAPTSIKLPSTLKTIHARTFVGLDPATVAVTLDSGNQSFKIDNNILYNEKKTKIVWQFGPLPNADLVIPEGITSLGGAYANRTDLKTVTLPKSLKYLNSYAFYSAKNLRSATFKGTKPTKFNSHAFQGCTSLKTVKLPSKLATISSSVFQSCSKLKSITLPKAVKTISSAAFRSCSALTKIKLPKGVKKVSENAFRSCKKLKSVTLPSKLESISSSAFRDCKALKSIKLPKSLKRVGDYAFEHTKIAKLVIPGKVSSIRSLAFANMTKLKTLTVKSGVKSIGWQSFTGCKKLKTIKLPKSVKKISSGAFYKSPVKTAKVKKGSYAAKWAKKHKIKRVYY